MQSTQLSCPHCGSALNFGVEIMPGTPVECLICMQTFTAPAKAPAPVAPAAKPPTAAPTAKVAVAEPMPAVAKPAAKPHAAPASVAIAAGEPPPPLPRPTARKKPETVDSSKILLVAVAAGLLFVLTGGLALAVWKITSALAPASSKVDDPLGAGDATKEKEKPKDAGAKPQDPDDGNISKEEAEWRKETQKIKLERKKLSFNSGADLEMDPIESFPKVSIPGLDQKKISAAIDNGVAYLRKTQLPNGSWHGGHSVGHASIGGLTLLECGVPVQDPAVQKAAYHVRSNIASLTFTYELSLAVLFLDRLGDPRDRGNIQGMALRLLAGQQDSAAWTYNCPILPPEQMWQLAAFLQSHQQTPVGATPRLQDPVAADKKADDPFGRFMEIAQAKANEQNPKDARPVMPKNSKGKVKPLPPNWLRAELQNLPIVQNQGKGKGKAWIVGESNGDNSNTQFAIMALWVARRHGVPTDQALLSATQRFDTSQNTDGGWGYGARHGSTNTMTCVGLIAEAMGHGVAPEIIAVNPKNPKQVLFKPVLEDSSVQKGLTALSKYVGEPSADAAKTSFPMQNLYFLWSVERVAMLYDLKRINGKDWYGWGAQILVHNQAKEGSWSNSHYHGATETLNTCFALLFLRRSNLVQDLTNNLRLHSAIQDSSK